MVKINLQRASVTGTVNTIPLGSFSCRFFELLEDDADIPIGRIRVKVTLSPVEGTDPLTFADHEFPPDGVLDVLQGAVTDMMSLMAAINQESNQILCLKIRGSCHILHSVYQAWKLEVPKHDYIVKLTECLGKLCTCSRTQVSKPDQDIAKFIEAVGKSVVQVALLITDHGRFSLEARDDRFADMEECIRRCEDLRKTFNAGRRTARRPGLF